MATGPASEPLRDPRSVGVASSAVPVLTINLRSKTFARNKERQILGAVSLEVAEGEIVAILGPSGSGKTTLLRMIAGLDQDFNGEVLSRGKAVRGPSSRRSLVFQDARLLGWRTVRQNVAFGLPKSMSTDGDARINEMLAMVGLQHAEHAWPRELSGGMEKRVALARALVGSPDLLMLDEPFGALDTPNRFALQDELIALHHRLGLSVLLITHDIEEAVYLADRILILGDTPARVLTDIPIDLPRPRSRISPGFDSVRAHVLARVLNTNHHP